MRKLLFILLLAPLLSFGQNCTGIYDVDDSVTYVRYKGNYIFNYVVLPDSTTIDSCQLELGPGAIRWNNNKNRAEVLDSTLSWVAISPTGTGSGSVTNVSALTIATTGTDITSTVANSTTTPEITLNVPTASATNRGALSSSDWTAFNDKYTQAAVNILVNLRKLASDSTAAYGFTSRFRTASDIHDSITSNQTTAGYGLSKSGNALSVDTPTIARTAQLAAYKLGNDSTGATGYVPQYQIDTIKANLRAAIASGAADSVIYATMHRLDTVKANLRAQIAAGTADSTVFATLFRLDTAKLNLLAYIATKQNQLNGTGLVRMTGTSVGYDNNTYLTTAVTSVATTAPLTGGTITGTGTISIPVATNSTDGYLSAADHSTFNGKQAAGSYMTYSDTTISAAYTLTSRDLFRSIHCTNGSNIALTIPTGLGNTFRCEVIQEGAGTVTPTASGTTLTFKPAGTKTDGGAVIIRMKATTDNLLIQGSIQP